MPTRRRGHPDDHAVCDAGAASCRTFGGPWRALAAGAFLLPFIEQKALYDQFDFTRAISDPANRPAITTPRVPDARWNSRSRSSAP